MRICILIPSLSGGGAEFVAREWASWLADKGHSVTAVTTIADRKAPLTDGYAVVHLADSSLPSRIRSFRRLIVEEKFQVVVSLLPYFNIMAIAATRLLKHRPKILISGRNVEIPFPQVHGKRYRSTRAIAKLLYPRADAYVAISHPVAAEAAALYRIPIHKIFVVPNPATAKVDAGGTLYTKNNRDRNRRTLNIVVPARIVAQKRPEVALQTALLCQQVFEDVTVHFFGVGELQGEVESLAVEMSVPVEMHGWMEAWYEHIPADSVVLLPSLVEGFGNVLVEAAAVGIPSVVSSRCLGSADAIVPGISGELAMSDSPDAYARAISKAFDLDMNYSKLWLKRFTASSSGTFLLQAMKEVLP
ncbi:glycosyltransferase [Rhodococcoides fascians]|uniref:glycosyltransferase n=1 Tax=Rhodococcoides fascians TaxID=1828 RepID=UPI0009B7E8EE|nr:glycosyltransferase [Rhodococcus fascians]